jgi:hypothetical protein
MDAVAAMCATTSRTVQPGHIEAALHCSSLSAASSPASADRSPSTTPRYRSMPWATPLCDTASRSQATTDVTRQYVQPPLKDWERSSGGSGYDLTALPPVVGRGHGSAALGPARTHSRPRLPDRRRRDRSAPGRGRRDSAPSSSRDGARRRAGCHSPDSRQARSDVSAGVPVPTGPGHRGGRRC